MNCNNVKACLEEIAANAKNSSGCQKNGCLMSLDRRPSVVVREQKKRYELQNDGALIARFQVDGQMIDSQADIKCDNMLFVVPDNIVILIELKGSDLRHALEQISHTLDVLKDALTGCRVYGRIVRSRRTNVPDLKTCPQYISLKRRLAGYRGNIADGVDEMVEKVYELRT